MRDFTINFEIDEDWYFTSQLYIQLYYGALERKQMSKAYLYCILLLHSQPELFCLAPPNCKSCRPIDAQTQHLSRPMRKSPE